MRFKNYSFFIIVICALLLFVALGRLYYYITDDFTLRNIGYPTASSQREVISSFTQQEIDNLRNILKQPFYYMDKGAQSYAFISQDQEYVIKFFKFKHLKPKWFIECLPQISPFNHLKAHHCIKKDRKHQNLFESYELAFKNNRENSQLVYVHLTPTTFLPDSVTLFDKIGRKHVLEADHAIFVIQKKGVPLRTRLNKLFQMQQIDEVKHTLQAILNMIVQEHALNIYDHDHGVLKNTGFVGERPFHLDVGKLMKNTSNLDPQFYVYELKVIIWKIDNWIKRLYPENHKEINDFLAQAYLNLTGQILDMSGITYENLKNNPFSK